MVEGPVELSKNCWKLVITIAPGHTTKSSATKLEGKQQECFASFLLFLDLFIYQIFKVNLFLISFFLSRVL